MTSCGAKYKLKFDKGSIVDQNDNAYMPVAMVYKPRTYVSDDKYATLKHPIYGKINLYVVDGTDGEWLYCPTDDTLYARVGVSVPTLEEMAPTSALVSTSGDKELSLAILEDKEVVESFADLIIAGEAKSVEDNAKNPTKTYRISFISEKYKFIVYSVTYFEYSDGTYRLYDRDQMLYFEIGDEVHELLNADSEITTSEES